MHVARLLHAPYTLPFAKGHIGPWLICAGYDRHQIGSILACTVGKRIYASHTCVGAICGHRSRWMRLGSTLCR